MSGLKQGPPPAGAANSTRFNLDSYEAADGFDLEARRAAFLDAFKNAGLVLDPRTFVATSTAPAPHKPHIRLNLTGEVVGTVLEVTELAAALATMEPKGRLDVDVWHIHRSDVPKGDE